MIRKTKYFASQFYNLANLEDAIEEAEKKRDEFLNQNKNLISEIVSESIQACSGQHNLSVSVIITLSYYNHN